MNQNESDKQDYGDDYVVITDEDGNEYELECLSDEDILYNGNSYRAFLPVSENEEEAYEMILFRVVEEDGEEFLETIDDDDEAEKVYELFMDRLYEDEDEE